MYTAIAQGFGKTFMSIAALLVVAALMGTPIAPAFANENSHHSHHNSHHAHHGHQDGDDEDDGGDSDDGDGDDDGGTPVVDVCPNVTGDQAEGPCADTLCESPAAWDMDAQACVTPIVIPPTDVCPNVTGTQTEGPCADTLCVSPATWNSDTQTCVAPVVDTGTGDTGGGSGPSDTAPTAPAPQILGGGVIGGGQGNAGGGPIGGGQVLGASCGVYVNKYIRFGHKNDSDQVTKLQQFLNKWEKSGLTESGVYDQATLDAVKLFQSHHEGDILTPWGIKAPTGIVYKTTLRMINNIECPGVQPDIPTLTPWTKETNE